MQWAATQNEEVVSGKSFAKSWSVVDTSKGVYRPAEVILMKEGGEDSPSAIKATVNIINKCRQLQGKWMIYNHMSERPEYLHLRQEHTEEMAKSVSYTHLTLPTIYSV